MMHVFRVHVLQYPAGSREPGWHPGGDWSLTTDFTRVLGCRRFAWPSTRRTFINGDRARAHARLLESFGAQVEVQRSRPVEWDSPAPTSPQSRPRIRARTRAGAE